MRLEPAAMESLCEGVLEEVARTGVPVRQVVEKMWIGELKSLVTKAELLRGIGDLRRKEKFRVAFGEEIAVDPVNLETVVAVEREFDYSRERAAEIMEVLRYLGGDLVEAKPVWKREESYTLRHGEEEDYQRGPGESWLHCAVLIRHGGRVVRIFPERRVIGRRAAGWMGTKGGETLRMEWLSLDCEELDREKIITRFAAAMQMHHSASGLKNAAHVAKLTGRTRAAGAAQRAGLVKDYYRRTDGAAGFAGVSSAQRLKQRAKQSRAKRPAKPNNKNEK